MRLSRVIYLWQQPEGHAGQCGGQGQGSAQMPAHKAATSNITNMLDDFIVKECFGSLMKDG
jgi:hypothetical protein